MTVLLVGGVVVWVVGAEDKSAQRSAGLPEDAALPRLGCDATVAEQRAWAKQITRDNPYVPEFDSHGNIVHPCVEPARLYAGADSPLSSEVMWPVTNGWKAGNQYELTVVTAGRSAQDRSAGLLVISRHDTRRRAKGAVIGVPGAGTIRITDAPLGRSVASWAPRRAKIRFRARSGVTGTLDLSTDSVSLDP